MVKPAQVRELHAKGLSSREIGDRIGVTHAVILKLFEALGLEPNYPSGGRPVPEAEHRRRYELYRQGYCDREIGERVGLSTGGVRKWRYRNNLPAN